MKKFLIFEQQNRTFEKSNKDAMMSESYEERKESIKKAALQVFIKYGYYKTTMDDISEGVGIKKNSLYYYFPNKESLFEELLNEEAYKMLDFVKDYVTKVENAEDKVKVFFREFLAYGRGKQQYLSISLETMIEFGQVVEEHYSDYICEVRNYLESILIEGCKRGEFIEINVGEIAEILIEFIISYQREQVRKIKSPGNINLNKMDKDITGLLNLVINGIRKV